MQIVLAKTIHKRLTILESLWGVCEMFVKSPCENNSQKAHNRWKFVRSLWDIVWLQGKLHPPQWKCKATSDLANGTIPEYPTPFFIELRAEVVLNRLTFFSHSKVPKIIPFARLRVALHFQFHLPAWISVADVTRLTVYAGRCTR